MTILITGGSGFVGLNLVQHLLERGERVVNFSLAPPPAAAARVFADLPGSLVDVEGDVRDTAALAAAFGEHRPGRAVHAAVITAGVEREREHPASIVAVNVQGTVNVLEAAREAGVGRIVYPSSGSVYGRSAFATPELDEATTLPVPESLYGITKYAAERICLRYRAVWGLDVVAARLGAVFGRWEYETGQRDTLSAPLLVTRLAAAGKEAVLPDEGRNDWVYALDVAAALVALLDLPEPRHEVYHVASGREWSMMAWCALLQARYPQFRYRIASGQEQANVNFHGGTRRAPLSPRRLREETGFAASHGLEEAFADYLDWLERHPL